MRVTDKPLPGDFVIWTRLDRATVPVTTVCIGTAWPDSERVVGGPDQRFGYAARHARGQLKDPSVLVWFDHAREHEAEQLEDVTNEPV